MALAHVEFDATDESGNLLSNVEARVEIEGGGLVSIYSDRAGSSALANPETFADGKISFYVAGGAYKITLTAGAFSRVLRYKPNGLLQEKDALTAAAVTFTPAAGVAATTSQGAIEEVAEDAKGFRKVRVAATTNIVIATALENGDTVDGVALVTGDLVLLTGQTAPAENGVYVVPASGAAARDGSFAAYNDMPGAYFSVMEGTAKADTLWRCTSNKGGTLGSTALVISEPYREKLTANRTYYVRTDASDSNDGLVDSAGGAFLTIQKAIDVAAALDASIYDVTIQVRSGTFTTSTGLVAKHGVGTGSITIIGDETTPSNVVLATNGAMTTSTGCMLARAMATTYKLKGVTLSSTATGTVFGILSSAGSYIEFQNVVFGSGMIQHLRAEDGGSIKATGNYSITSGGNSHYELIGPSTIRVQNVTVTLTGTPAFATAFATSNRLGFLIASGITFSGSATGTRYSASENGIITTLGAGANYFPGNAAGSTATGGQYN